MQKFTEGELKVMRILWQHDALKPSEIQERFPEPIKNPALRSYLAILVLKGHVARQKVGKAYFYRARTRRDSALSSVYRQMVDVFFGGSARGLVSHLIKEEKLTEEELLELRRLAEESEKPDGGAQK